MARMRPPYVSEHTRSQAERDLFGAIRDELPNDWTCLHSLGLAIHQRKPRLPRTGHQRWQHQLQRTPGVPAAALLEASLLWHQLYVEPQLLGLRGQFDRRFHAGQRV